MLHKYITKWKSMPKIFLRMFLYNYIFFLSLLFVICAGVWGFATHQRRQVFRERASSHCQALSEYFDSLFTSFDRLSVTVGHNARLRSLASDPVSELDFNLIDSTMLFSAQQDMITSLAMNSSISNLAIYLYGKDYVISSYGTSTLESFYQSLFLMEPNALSEYLRPLDAGSFLFLPRSEDSNSVLSQNSVYVISLVDTNGTRYANLFIFLDDREIGQHLERLVDSSENYYIFTNQNQTFLTNGEAASEEELLSLGHATSQTLFLLENADDWKFYVGTSPEYLKSQMLLITLVLAALWFAAAFIGIPVVFTLCRKNYKPIRELADLISQQAQNSKNASLEKKTQMEYETLKLAISSIFKDKHLLEEQLSIYKPVLINSLLLQLLENTGNSDSVISGLAALGVPIPYPCYKCISLQAVSIHQEIFINRALSMREHGALSCLFISIDRHTGYYLVNAPDCESCLAAVSSLTALLDKTAGVSCIGIGCCVQKADNISHSYRQAKEALRYLNLSAGSKCVSWEVLEPIQAQSALLPSLSAFSSLLLSGQFTDADKELQKYWKKNILQEYVPKSALVHFQQSLLSVLQQLKKDHGFCCDDTCIHSLQSWSVNMPEAFPELWQIWENIRESLARSFSYWKEERDSEDIRIFLDYLHEHIYEEDMSLSKMAATFHISESTVSRRIKAFTGYSFLDYVSNKRISHACSLLAETNMSVQEIAVATGYLNDVTFRRLFKKQMGITPSEYRQMNRR